MSKDRIIREKKPDPKYKDWGHKPRTYMVIDRPWDVMYDHSYGRVSPFFMGLLEKKLMGTKCPKCGDVFCPPRAHCWRHECKLEETEWMEMPLKGMLHSYTIMGFGGEAFLDQLPFILAYVRVEGANTMIASRLVGTRPEDVECDTPVTIHFIEDPTGNPMDIYKALKARGAEGAHPGEAQAHRGVGGREEEGVSLTPLSDPLTGTR